jgi:VAD1 Analog of StAR-related lipid transfer domain
MAPAAGMDVQSDLSQWLIGRSMSMDGIDDMMLESSAMEDAVVRNRCLSADAIVLPDDTLGRSPLPPDRVSSSSIGFWMFSSSSSGTTADHNKRSRSSPAFWRGETGAKQSPAADGDESSMDSTVGYYEASDFVPTNWTQAVNIIPPVGLAMVASGIAITHPLLFIMGAVTAFGTVQAVGAFYDCCIDGAWCRVAVQDDEKILQLSGTVSGVYPAGNLPDEFTVAEDDDESDLRLNALVSAPLQDKGELQQVVQADPSLRTATEDKDPYVLISDPSKFVNTDDALEWVNLHYPPLENRALHGAEFFGLNALEFFNVFFANDAPFTFQEIHRQRGDKDIQYGLWEDLPHVSQPSLHHDAKACSDFHVSSFRERVLKFNARTNSFFGPPFANTTKVQRVLMASKRLMVIESATTVTQIPFCDRFHVLERWVITAEKKGDRYVSKLSVYSQVFFSKSCPFEAQIVSKSKETFVEIANLWCTMAQTALKLTEESRLKRIRGEQQKSDWEHLNDDASVSYPEAAAEPSLEEMQVTNESDKEECIEVQHRSRFRSFVLGEEGGGADQYDEEEEDDLIEVVSNKGKQRTRAGRILYKRASFVKMGRSLSNLVKRKSSPSLDLQ